MSRPGIFARYGDWLSLPAHSAPVTLLEGDTPLIPAPRLAAALGGGFGLWLKFEGLNPTGSFKDRGMSVAITAAVAEGARTVICASTGNTAAAAAAYAARAGLRCLVLIPEGKVAAGKLAGAQAYGAQVIAVRGSFDDALRLVRQAGEQAPLAIVNSINPHRLEGQKTAAFEICDALHRAPDWVCLPVGNAGNITAYWMGFCQYYAAGKTASRPRLLGVQAAGAAPLVQGRPVEQPETVATAIQIGRPARGEQALAAAQESGGCIVAVEDRRILDMQRHLAHEGVWVEPASAAGLAGLAQEIEAGRIDVRGQSVAATLTGHGLKDPDAVGRWAAPPITIDADADSLLALIGSG